MRSPAVLEELLRNRRWLRALARELARDEAAADDLSQEVWVAALRSPPRFPGAVRAWLRRVVFRRGMELKRGEAARRRREAERPGRAPAPAPDEVLARAELEQRAARAVTELDEPYRTTLLLRFFEDLGPAEIAARTGVPLETVRTRLRRGLERVRARLDREEGGRSRWVPLLLAPRGGGSATPEKAVPAAKGATVVLGGLVMGAGTKAVVAGIVVAGALWWTLARSTPPDAVPVVAPDRATDTVAAAPPAVPAEPAANPPVDPGPGESPSTATPPKPPPASPSGVGGTVVDQDGAVVAGAGITVEDGGRPSKRYATVSDAEGRFRLPEVGEGEWLLRCDRPEPREEWERPWALLVHGGDGDLRVVLRRRPPPEARVVVEVVDAATGESLEPLRVELVEHRRGIGGGSPIAAEVGAASAVGRGLRAGPWRAWALVEGRPPAGQSFLVRRGEREVRVRVEVGEYLTLRGRIDFGSLARPDSLGVLAVAEEAFEEVPAFARGKGVSSSVRAGPDGSFSLPLLRPGRYQIATVHHRREGPIAAARAVVDLPMEGDRELVLRLREAGYLAFRSAGLAPGSVAELSLAEGGGPLERRDMYDGGGRVALGQHVPPGPVRWRMRFLADPAVGEQEEAAETQEGTVTAVAGERVEVVVPVIPKR